MSTFRELLGQHIMSTPVLSTSPESSVNQLERHFVRCGLSAMPVVEHRQIIGIISTLDIVRLTMQNTPSSPMIRACKNLVSKEREGYQPESLIYGD